MPNHLQAVVFDFDGVLANTEPLHLRAYQEVFDRLGITLTADAYYARYLGYDDEGVFRAVGEDHKRPFGAGEIERLVRRKSQTFDGLMEGGDVLFAGAVECVRRLAAAVPLAIASGALRREIVAVLRSAGLDSFFRTIVAAGETPRTKPAPDPYAKAAGELERSLGAGVRLDPGCIVAIEDSHWGLESARAAGLLTVAVTQTYRADELAADLIVTDLGQITVARLDGLCGR